MNQSEQLSQTYSRTQSPVEILSSDTEVIMDFLSLMLDDIENKDSIPIFREFTNEQILKWQRNITKEMYFLAQDGLITFKLAKVIYQIIMQDDISTDEEILPSQYFSYNHNSYVWVKEEIEARYA